MRKLLLVVILLAACSSAPPAASPSSPPPPASTPPAATPPAVTPPAGADWRVLAEDLWLGEAPFAVQAALNAEQLATLWAALGRNGDLPEVDFDREAVLFLGMAGSSSCPEQLTGLVVDHANGRVYGEWSRQVPPGAACTDDLRGQGLLIAVPTEVLPEGRFLLSLRQERICPECPDQVLVER
ncbi:MAG TPA: hypothetical protein VM305_03845 [Candidatus Limnocylindrales bacterium]|nr:hypothetical protein [Candidatus Limnocylindrales bacterium]